MTALASIEVGRDVLGIVVGIGRDGVQDGSSFTRHLDDGSKMSKVRPCREVSTAMEVEKSKKAAV